MLLVVVRRKKEKKMMMQLHCGVPLLTRDMDNPFSSYLTKESAEINAMAYKLKSWMTNPFSEILL